MKKITLHLLLICLSISGFSQSYQTALKKLNDFLKTFDNGYYGYMEIKDGYLYDRFKSGKYCKVLISDLGYASTAETGKKVVLKCKSGSCVFSTYTDSYHEQMSFSQSDNFNTQALVKLLDDLVYAYKNTNSTTSVDYDKYKSNIDIMSSGNNSSSSTKTTPSTKAENTEKAQKALDELNEYMVTLDNGRYKGMEVTNGYIIQNYEGGQSSKAKIEDIDRVEINTQYNYAKLACKGDSKCVYSSITGGYHDYFNFNTTGKSLTKMETLLNNFLSALKKASGQNISSNTSSSSNSTIKTEAQKIREQKEKERKANNSKTEDTDDFWGDIFDEVRPTEKTNTANPSKYAKPLKDLNDYLKTFNSATYGDVEVKNNDVIFNFKFSSQKFNSSIRISELLQNTTVIKGKSVGTFGSEEIKILCKNESKCFYSTYSNSTTDHFRFFSNTVKDLTKMEQLVKEFINALK